jgi:hypothetical protein
MGILILVISELNMQNRPKNRFFLQIVISQRDFLSVTLCLPACRQCRSVSLSVSSCFFVVLLTVLSSTSIFPQDLKVTDKATQDSTIKYKDGIYEGISRATYKFEPYWGNIHLTIKNISSLA